MQEESPASTDIGLGVVLIVVALTVIYGTLELPEGSFEPLGSASIPQYVSAGIIVLSLWIIARAISRSRAQAKLPASSRVDDELPYPLRPWLAVALVCLAVIYVGVMAMDWVRFSVATTVFTLATVGMLTKFERRVMPTIVVLALVLGVGLEYAFTQIFVIDLP
jgi:putative tricarboxylic transport membrane protein